MAWQGEARNVFMSHGDEAGEMSFDSCYLARLRRVVSEHVFPGGSRALLPCGRPHPARFFNARPAGPLIEMSNGERTDGK